MSEEVRDLDQEIIEDASSESINTQDAASLSFDDLDEISNEGVESVKESEAQAKKQEDKQPIEGESESEEIEASSKEEEEKVEEIKKLIAKYNDEETEIAANSIFKHKINGEEVDVELQELLNNYSGKVSYEQKFQDLASRRREFEDFKNSYDKDIQDIYTVLNSFKDSMKQNDAMGALNHFAAFSGMKPYEFQESLINSLAPEVVRRAHLSEEQLRSEKLQAENEYLRQQQESEQVKFQEQQSLIELQNEIRQLQEAHGISDDAFYDAYHELVESGYDGEMSPEAVTEYYIHSNAFSRAGDILSQVSPSLVQQENVIDSLQKVIVENPSFDNNDLIELVNEVYGDYIKQTSKNVSNKVAKSAPKKKQNVTPAKPKVEEYLDWEDL